MNLLDYIRGNRKGREAHRIEKDSMTDPFLADAIDGFDSIDDDHLRRIKAIQSVIGNKDVKTHQRSIWTSIAAVALVVFALAGYLLIGNQESNSLYAQTTEPAIIDIYLPEAYYEENIAAIAQKNTELTKDVSIKLSLYKNDDIAIIEQDLNHALAELEPRASNGRRLETRERVQEVLEIYLPKGMENLAEETGLIPHPVIGFDGYKEYLVNNLKRPTDFVCQDRKGKVGVEFSVDKNGVPYNLKAKYPLCGSFDIEAMRLVKEGPKWTYTKERVLVSVEF